MDLKDIRAIIELMKKNSIAEFELEKEDFKIKLKRGGSSGATSIEELSAPPGGPYLMAGPTPSPALAAPSSPHPSGSSQGGGNNADAEVKSPMIGTFYRAPSPESDNYVEVGSEVNPDTVVCIIEAMKVMNEIKAEVKGVITEILVENAKPVEFGQPLFRIRSS